MPRLPPALFEAGPEPEPEPEPQPQPQPVAPGHLANLLAALPDVASNILYWLCATSLLTTWSLCCSRPGATKPAPRGAFLSLPASARSLCALRCTCRAFSDWQETIVLSELIRGQRRPADASLGGIGVVREGGESLASLIDAKLGPRVPEDFGTIEAALAELERKNGGKWPSSLRIAAGSFTVTSPIAIPSQLSLVGSRTAETILDVRGCVGITSAGVGASLRHLTICSSAGSIGEYGPDGWWSDGDAQPGHSVWIRGGDLLLEDCRISCAIGNGVVIGARGATFDSSGQPAPDRPPRLLRCTVESATASGRLLRPTEVGGHDGVAAGVCIECSAAELIDCVFRGNFNQVELGYAQRGTLLRNCRMEGAKENGVYSYDESIAQIEGCQINGGTECVRACDGSKLTLVDCWLGGFSSVGISAQDEGTVVVVGECVTIETGKDSASASSASSNSSSSSSSSKDKERSVELEGGAQVTVDGGIWDG